MEIRTSFIHVFSCFSNIWIKLFKETYITEKNIIIFKIEIGSKWRNFLNIAYFKNLTYPDLKQTDPDLNWKKKIDKNH